MHNVTFENCHDFVWTFSQDKTVMMYINFFQEEQTRKIRSGELNARNRNFRMHY